EERQLQALVEGAVLGSYDAGRWKSDAGKPAVERFIVCGADAEIAGAAGRPALAAVGRSSTAPPRLIVVRHEPADAVARPRLALVGKAVTFDAGGYFLKPQSDIVRQKGDMAGGAAVLAAMGA